MRLFQYLDLVNFFQRPLIPIGDRDKVELHDIYPCKDGKDHGFTHWMIALFWYEDGMRAGWKVTVCPVAEGRVFWMVPPLFHTFDPSTFDNAWKLSEVLKACSLDDRLAERFNHPYWDGWADL